MTTNLPAGDEALQRSARHAPGLEAMAVCPVTLLCQFRRINAGEANADTGNRERIAIEHMRDPTQVIPVQPHVMVRHRCERINDGQGAKCGGALRKGALVRET